MDKQFLTTRILYICSDEGSFAIWQCMAAAIEGLPPVEIYHALDASDGLSIIENVQPDVVILDLEYAELVEKEIFQEGMTDCRRAPIILHAPSYCENAEEKESGEFHYMGSCETLDGVHKTLIIATSIAVTDEPPSKANTTLH